jgi:archaellum component FlaF (FlaF/FlaG flagellin family)
MTSWLDTLAGGVNAYTTVTEAFVQPAVASSVAAAVANSSWMAVGARLYVSSGYYEVVSKADTSHVTIKNLGSAGNATPGASVSSTSTVAPAGVDGPTGPGLFLARGVTCTGVLTSGAQSDTTVYTVPASPTGAGRAVVTGVVLRVKTALVGGGSNALTVGATAGTTGYLLSQTIAASASPAVGYMYGLPFIQLGALFVAADGYNAQIAAAATIVVSMVVTGAVTTAPVLECDVMGWLVGT